MQQPHLFKQCFRLRPFSFHKCAAQHQQQLLIHVDCLCGVGLAVECDALAGEARRSPKLERRRFVRYSLCPTLHRTLQTRCRILQRRQAAGFRRARFRWRVCPLCGLASAASQLTLETTLPSM